jgi:hypothetical protein
VRVYGLIRRIEHTHTYALTPDGQRLAVFCTKLYNRLLRLLAAADQPQARPRYAKHRHDSLVQYPDSRL